MAEWKGEASTSRDLSVHVSTEPAQVTECCFSHECLRCVSPSTYIDPEDVLVSISKDKVQFFIVHVLHLEAFLSPLHPAGRGGWGVRETLPSHWSRCTYTSLWQLRLLSPKLQTPSVSLHSFSLHLCRLQQDGGSHLMKLQVRERHEALHLVRLEHG